MNKLTEEQSMMLQNMGALGYPVSKICSIMSFDREVFEKEFRNENSEIKKLYNKGVDYSGYLIDLKLFEMAKSGDIKAINKLDERKKQVKNK
jgi:hypothetical protein